jgi:hypothetical protein
MAAATALPTVGAGNLTVTKRPNVQAHEVWFSGAPTPQTQQAVEPVEPRAPCTGTYRCGATTTLCSCRRTCRRSRPLRSERMAVLPCDCCVHPCLIHYRETAFGARCVKTALLRSWTAGEWALCAQVPTGRPDDPVPRPARRWRHGTTG